MWNTKYNSETKIWNGACVPHVFNSQLSLGQAVLWLLDRNPTKVAQISDNNNKHVTNADLRLKTVRAALNLEALGFKKDDVFTIVAKNHHDLAPVLFAAFCLGCPVNTAGIWFNESELVQMFGISKPKAVFCEVDVYDTVKASLDELRNNAQIFTFENEIDGSKNVDTLFAEASYENHYQASNLDAENNVAMIVCSSGTTGLPKAVSLSHAAILTNASNGMFHLNDQDIFLYFSPLNWIAGILVLMSCTVQGATRLITTAPFTTDTFLQIVENRQVTGVFTASYHVNFLLKSTKLRSANLTKLRKFYCGGSKISSEVIDEMNKFLPNGAVYVSYGTSETGVNCTNYPLPNNRSVGKILCGIKMKITDDDGQKLGIGECGEVCILPMSKSLGYFGNEKATAEIFDSDGFIKTGDVGYFDNDGYLILVDRKKHIFKYYSTHISPSEFEDLLSNHPAIKLVCIVDVPDPEEMAPDLPAAVIVKSGIVNISEEEVHRIICKRLPKEKRLVGGVYFTEELPMTESGKIKRKEARKIAQRLFNLNRQQKKNENFNCSLSY